MFIFVKKNLNVIIFVPKQRERYDTIYFLYDYIITNI